MIKFSGQPLLLDNSIPQDEDFIELLEIYRPAVNAVNEKIEGSLQVTLDGSQYNCRREECNFGNLIADAMVMYKATVSAPTWTDTPIGLMNGGGIRATIMPGINNKVTRGELLGALPFGNQVMSLTLSGSDLWTTLELGVRSNGETSRGEFLQMSGLQVVYDISKPAMSRVVSVKTRCGYCNIPTYSDLDLLKNYTVVLHNFLGDGNDGHYILKEKAFNKKFEDLADIDVVTWYFNTYSPVFAEVQNRIRFVQQQSSGSRDLSKPFVLIILFILAPVSLF